MIVWSDEAKSTYEEGIDDLLIKKGSVKVALDFEQKTNDFVFE